MKKIDIKCNKGDRVLSVLCASVEGLSYAYSNELLKRKDIRVNGDKIKENQRVEMGDIITVFIDEKRLKTVENYKEIYRDDNVYIVNKAKGIEVCDGEKNLVKLILNKEKIKVYPVHRIDRNTDGLVIFALTKESEEELLRAFKEKNIIRKTYLAEVIGTPKSASNERAYLVKKSKEALVEVSKNQSVNAKVIETQYKKVAQSSGLALLEVTLLTGRTHQIRAHLAFLGFPIIGDGKYGNKMVNDQLKAKEPHLTSHRLTFNFEENSPLYYLNAMRFTAPAQWEIFTKS